MKTMNLKEQLQILLKDKTPKVFGAILRPYPKLKEDLIKQTNFLPIGSSIAHRLYHLFNNITEMPLCHNCKNKTASFWSFNQGYAPYCGVKCANSCEDKKETTQKAWDEKYGSKEARVAHVKEVYKKAMLEKTGFASNFHNPEFQKKHNGGSVAWDDKTRDKRKGTCQKKYNADTTFGSSIIKNKIKSTLEEKYENGHHMRDPKVILKREGQCLEKYGVSNPLQHPEVQERKKQTCLEKYGVSNPSQRHIEHIDLWNNDQFIKDTFLNKDNTIRYKEMMAFFGCTNTSGIRQRLQILGVKYQPYTGYSSFEIEIKEYLQSIDTNITIVERNRTIIKPYEIDLYLPEYKLGIEFHGLTWHSFGSRPNNVYLESKNKHLHKNKTTNANKANIQLLQIFENEWNVPTLQNIWKSVILAKLGKATKIYGRKCIIKEVNNTITTDFLRKNHLQQSMVGASVNIALYYEGVLVSIMTFGKARFKNTEQWELLRFCNILRHSIIGGFAKLLNYFIKTYLPTSIVSYANKRWSVGDVYVYNKFSFVSDIEPGYYYYHQDDTTLLKHRISFQKHKLPSILPKFNPALTETENMYENGYRKIYDAGQLKYTLTL
jgi:hypothetical protein